MTGAVNTKILVIGDVMLDEYIYGCADRISPEAPCVVLNNCSPSQTSLGGAANVAFQLSRSDYEVSIWSCIGTDDTGSIIISKLADNDIYNMIVQKDEIVTTRKTRYLTVSNHQLLRVDNDSQYTPIKEDYIALLHMIESGYFGVVILSDYDKGILSEDLCTSVIQSCKISNTKSVIDIKYSSIDKFSRGDVNKRKPKRI